MAEKLFCLGWQKFNVRVGEFWRSVQFTGMCDAFIDCTLLITLTNCYSFEIIDWLYYW